MDVAILSPCLFDNENLQGSMECREHIFQLGELFKFIKDNSNFKIEEYRKSPYDGYCMHIPKYNDSMLNNYIMTNVFAVIQKLLVKDYYIDLEGVDLAEPLSSLNLPENIHSDVFLRYINHVKDRSNQVIFLGKNNHQMGNSIEFKDEENYIVKASTQVDIELSDVLLPFLKESNTDEIFPRKNICAYYNTYVKEKIQKERLDQPEKIALYEQIGNLVAKYNGYEKDERLTKINSSKSQLRKVYKKTQGTVYYLSFDVESGGYEVFNSTFKHLGQYSFSCDLVKVATPQTHKLKS